MRCQSETMKRRRQDSLQSSQPVEWLTKALVQTRMATNRLARIGATMQTMTMACCWVEESGSIIIVRIEGICRRGIQNGMKKSELQSGPWTLMIRKAPLQRSIMAYAVSREGEGLKMSDMPRLFHASFYAHSRLLPIWTMFTWFLIAHGILYPIALTIDHYAFTRSPIHLLMVMALHKVQSANKTD